MLEEKLGRVMGTKEVAEYLNLDERTVRLHHHLFGGTQVGRKFLFFERTIIDAIQARSGLCGSGEEGREEDREEVQDQKRGDRMGSPDAGKARKRLEAAGDRHNL